MCLLRCPVRQCAERLLVQAEAVQPRHQASQDRPGQHVGCGPTVHSQQGSRNKQLHIAAGAAHHRWCQGVCQHLLLHVLCASDTYGSSCSSALSSRTCCQPVVDRNVDCPGTFDTMHSLQGHCVPHGCVWWVWNVSRELLTVSSCVCCGRRQPAGPWL
jgi:hypothetical protein